MNITTVNDKSIKEYTPYKTFIRPKNKKIVLVGGCFDILHQGHLEFLQKAKNEGDFLIVALEPDGKILYLKKSAPIHEHTKRAINLIETQQVDEVLLLPDLRGFEEYNQLVKDIKPSVIAITADDPMNDKKCIQAQAIGAKVKIVVDRIQDISSSKIRQCFKSNAFKGIVFSGKKEAQKLNFPTANIVVDFPAHLSEGMYIVN